MSANFAPHRLSTRWTLCCGCFQGLLQLQATFTHAVTPLRRGALGKVRSFPRFHRQFTDRSAVPSVLVAVFLMPALLRGC